MKNYEKPNFEITSYEAEDVITLSAKTNLSTDGVQKTFNEVSF